MPASSEMVAPAKVVDASALAPALLLRVPFGQHHLALVLRQQQQRLPIGLALVQLLVVLIGRVVVVGRLRAASVRSRGRSQAGA